MLREKDINPVRDLLRGLGIQLVTSVTGKDHEDVMGINVRFIDTPGRKHSEAWTGVPERVWQMPGLSSEMMAAWVLWYVIVHAEEIKP